MHMSKFACLHAAVRVHLEEGVVACGAGYISKTVYDGELKTGWRWQPYNVLETKIAAPGAGVGGEPATCVALNPQGGLTFE